MMFFFCDKRLIEMRVKIAELKQSRAELIKKYDIEISRLEACLDDTNDELSELRNIVNATPKMKHVSVNYDAIIPISIERMFIDRFKRMGTWITYSNKNSTEHKSFVFDTTQEEHARLLVEFDTYKKKTRTSIKLSKDDDELV